jgi:cytochrome b561
MRLRNGSHGYGVVTKLLHWATVAALVAQSLSRVAWRRTAGLPPWAETLTEGEKTWAHWTEKLLLTLLFVIPLTGISLVAVSYDLLPLHIAAHIGFFLTIAAHLGLVVKRTLVQPDRLLHRML